MAGLVPDLDTPEGLFRSWLLLKKQEVERSLGVPISLTEFAARVGVGQAAMSTWIHGTRSPSYEAAVSLAKALDDYSVLEIFGYTHPFVVGLPTRLRDALSQAALETSKRLAASGLTDLSSPAAISIATEVFSEFGFTVNLTEG